MNKESTLALVKQVGVEILGSILVAAGISNFAINANFPVSGVSGIALIFYKLFGLPIGLTILIINIPIAIVCYKLIGRKFLISSIRCMIISSVMIDYIAPKFPTYDGSRLLAAICTGVLCGLGYTIIYMVNSSTGGADFLSLAIKNKMPHVAIGKITFSIDAFVILAGGFLFSDIDGIIYGIIQSYIIALVANKLMYGVNSGKMTMIVTDEGKKICDVIDACCGRGSTIFKAQGGYTEHERDVVMCACSDREMYLVQKAVKETDPDAFLVVLESNEVHGEGFHTIQLGEHE